jgi:DivIVA domain-containing protein
MDRLTLDRIRRKTFPVARRGYSKRAVHTFLDRLANWLEMGEGDPARAEVMRRELARVGERTAAILHEAEQAADRIRADAEREAAMILRRAREDAERIRGSSPAPPRRSAATRERPDRRAPARGSASRPGAR